MYGVKLVTTDKETACGPASLKMLLGYYGVEVGLDALIEECHVGVAGCSAADLMRVGRAHGLDMASYKMDAAALLRQDRPAIVWLRYHHFVVFDGVNEDGNPVICNPSRGKYWIDAESFAKIATGIENGTLIAICAGNPQDQMPEDYFGENEIEPDYFDD